MFKLLHRSAGSCVSVATTVTVVDKVLVNVVPDVTVEVISAVNVAVVKVVAVSVNVCGVWVIVDCGPRRVRVASTVVVENAVTVVVVATPERLKQEQVTCFPVCPQRKSQRYLLRESRLEKIGLIPKFKAKINQDRKAQELVDDCLLKNPDFQRKLSNNFDS